MIWRNKKRFGLIRVNRVSLRIFWRARCCQRFIGFCIVEGIGMDRKLSGMFWIQGRDPSYLEKFRQTLCNKLLKKLKKLYSLEYLFIIFIHLVFYSSRDLFISIAFPSFNSCLRLVCNTDFPTSCNNSLSQLFSRLDVYIFHKRNFSSVCCPRVKIYPFYHYRNNLDPERECCFVNCTPCYSSWF